MDKEFDISGDFICFCKEILYIFDWDLKRFFIMDN